MQVPNSRENPSHLGHVNRQTSIRSQGERVDDKSNYMSSEIRQSKNNINGFKIIVEVDKKENAESY